MLLLYDDVWWCCCLLVAASVEEMWLLLLDLLLLDLVSAAVSFARRLQVWLDCCYFLSPLWRCWCCFLGCLMAETVAVAVICLMVSWWMLVLLCGHWLFFIEDDYSNGINENVCWVQINVAVCCHMVVLGVWKSKRWGWSFKDFGSKLFAIMGIGFKNQFCCNNFSILCCWCFILFICDC